MQFYYSIICILSLLIELKTKADSMNRYDSQHNGHRAMKFGSDKWIIVIGNPTRDSNSIKMDKRSQKFRFCISSTRKDQPPRKATNSQTKNFASLLSHMHKTLQRIKTWCSQFKTHSKSKRFDELSVLGVCNGSSEYKSFGFKRFLKFSIKNNSSQYKSFPSVKLDEFPTKMVEDNDDENIFNYKTPSKMDNDSDTKSLSRYKTPRTYLSTKVIKGSDFGNLSRKKVDRSQLSNAKLSTHLLIRNRISQLILRQKALDRLSTKSICSSRSSWCSSSA